MSILKNFTTRIKSAICKDCHEPNAKIFNSSTAMTAKSAYMHSKYGQSLSQKEILQKFFGDVNGAIRNRCNQGFYHLMIELDDDIKEFLPKIVSHYRDELGYKIAVINNDTQIIETIGAEPVKLMPQSTFIILMWNTPDISEAIFKSDDEDVVYDFSNNSSENEDWNENEL